MNIKSTDHRYNTNHIWNKIGQGSYIATFDNPKALGGGTRWIIVHSIKKYDNHPDVVVQDHDERFGPDEYSFKEYFSEQSDSYLPNISGLHEYLSVNKKFQLTYEDILNLLRRQNNDNI